MRKNRHAEAEQSVFAVLQTSVTGAWASRAAAYAGSQTTTGNVVFETLVLCFEDFSNFDYHIPTESRIFAYQFAIKKIEIKLYRIIILPVVLYGCET